MVAFESWERISPNNDDTLITFFNTIVLTARENVKFERSPSERHQWRNIVSSSTITDSFISR